MNKVFLNKFIEIINSSHKKHEKLIKILEVICYDANITEKKYFIMGSYALRYSREINDLDVVMEPTDFNKLENLNYGQIIDFEGRKKFILNLTKEFSIEIFNKEKTIGYPNNEFSLKYLLENNGLTTDDKGNMHYNLNTLLKWKTTVNREKDNKDIVLIKKILSNK